MAASQSPLKPYINGRLLVQGEAAVSLVDGRWVETPANQYLVKLFIKRAQYSGVSSGSRPLPLSSQLDGNMMPGASGDAFYYRGYAIDFAAVPLDFKIGDDESALTFNQVLTQYTWLATGLEAVFKFGDDPLMRNARIQRSSGIFGGQGIDEIIYSEIGGVEIQLTGGEVQV